MEKRQIVNIVNFIRACEPREVVDLYEPVLEQIRVMRENGLRGTFLVQYDTLLDNRFTDILKSLDPAQFELGVWHEIVQPETEKLGIEWHGRYPWDWHAHCGFSVGYTKHQREMLVDELFETFRAVFGYFPRVFGSWFFDSHTARYVADHYEVDAFCNCKEQYGTDGYTLWGGYYGQAYYPSRTNVFMPAQTETEQLNVPLFRMLGSDPVYQYDYGMDYTGENSSAQGVITLEPVYGIAGGSNHKWVDWFLRENYNGDCLTFGYAQAGQENSFSWPKMKGGIEYQFPIFAALQKAGKLCVEPLGETGRWFKQQYRETAPSAITAHTAYDDDGKNSVWYCSKYYRLNAYNDKGFFRIRDLHLFDERFPDPFEDRVCVANDATYDTLPYADGNRYSGNGVLAGIRVVNAASGAEIPAEALRFTDLGDGNVELDFGAIRLTLMENSFTVNSDRPFRLENRIGQDGGCLPEVTAEEPQKVSFRYKGTAYALRLDVGRFEGPNTICSENNRVTVLLGQR